MLEATFHEQNVFGLHVRGQKLPRGVTPALEIVLDASLLHIKSEWHGHPAQAHGRMGGAPMPLKIRPRPTAPM